MTSRKHLPVAPSIDEQYDRAKRRRRIAQGYDPRKVTPLNSTPGHCMWCSDPILWGKLPEGRWVPLDPEPRPDGAYALLPGKRAMPIPLGATTTPEVVRHHRHPCGVKSA